MVGTWGDKPIFRVVEGIPPPLGETLLGAQWDLGAQPHHQAHSNIWVEPRIEEVDPEKLFVINKEKGLSLMVKVCTKQLISNIFNIFTKFYSKQFVQPWNFRSAFSNADLNADHKILGTRTFC